MQCSHKQRYLIIHADDGGMSPAVNRAIIDLLKEGIVTSASLMTPTLHFEEIATYFQQHPEYDVGVHITLTSTDSLYPRKPISPKESVFSLVNTDGFFLSKKELTQRATPVDIEIEIRAQIEHILNKGILPSHLDTHRGIVFENQRFFEIYLELAREYNLVPMLVKPNYHAQQWIVKRNLNINFKALEELMATGLPLLDFLYMSTSQLKNREQLEHEYIEVIRNLPAGISQIIIHPEVNSDECSGLDAHNYRPILEFSFFSGNRIHQIIEEEKITLINWKELVQKYRSEPSQG